MSEKFGGPAGIVPKEITPVSKVEIVADTELNDSKKLNSLIAEKVALLEKGIENGDELAFENKLTDLEKMIDQLQAKV